MSSQDGSPRTVTLSPAPVHVVLIREWEQQMSSSGCCGRLEGDFLCQDREPVFAERRARMEAAGRFYRAVRERFGEAVSLEVVDPRNFLTLVAVLARDFWRYGIPAGEAFNLLARLPVTAVVVNGRLVARGEIPPPEDGILIVESFNPPGAAPTDRLP